MRLAQQGGYRQINLPLSFANQGHFLHLDGLHGVAEHGEKRLQLLKQEEALGIRAGTLQRCDQVLQTFRLRAALLHDRGGGTFGHSHHRLALRFSRCDYIGFQLFGYLLNAFLLHRQFGLSPGQLGTDFRLHLSHKGLTAGEASFMCF